MRKLSKVTVTILEADPRMKVCCLSPHVPHTCSKKIDWHHNLIYAGKQSDIPNTILAVCSEAHDQANNKEVKEVLDWIMLNQMTERDFSLLPKSNYRYKLGYLNRKYGKQ